MGGHRRFCTVWLGLLFWPLLSKVLDAVVTACGFCCSVFKASYFFGLPTSVNAVLLPGMPTHPSWLIFSPFELLSALQGSCHFLCEAPWLSPAPLWCSCSPSSVQHPAIISAIAYGIHACLHIEESFGPNQTPWVWSLSYHLQVIALSKLLDLCPGVSALVKWGWPHLIRVGVKIKWQKDDPWKALDGC